jgi:hypothetical protein
MLSCLAESAVCPSMLCPKTNRKQKKRREKLSDVLNEMRINYSEHHLDKISAMHQKNKTNAGLINEPYRAYLYPRGKRKSSRISSILVIWEKISTRFPLSFNFGSSCRPTIVKY